MADPDRERGHYELSAGGDYTSHIKAIEQFSSVGGMLPEQVWDYDDIPSRGMFRGRSAAQRNHWCGRMRSIEAAGVRPPMGACSIAFKLSKTGMRFRKANAPSRIILNIQAKSSYFCDLLWIHASYRGS